MRLMGQDAQAFARAYKLALAAMVAVMAAALAAALGTGSAGAAPRVIVLGAATPATPSCPTNCQAVGQDHRFPDLDHRSGEPVPRPPPGAPRRLVDQDRGAEHEAESEQRQPERLRLLQQDLRWHAQGEGLRAQADHEEDQGRQADLQAQVPVAGRGPLLIPGADHHLHPRHAPAREAEQRRGADRPDLGSGVRHQPERQHQMGGEPQEGQVQRDRSTSWPVRRRTPSARSAPTAASTTPPGCSTRRPSSPTRTRSRRRRRRRRSSRPTRRPRGFCLHCFSNCSSGLPLGGGTSLVGGVGGLRVVGLPPLVVTVVSGAVVAAGAVDVVRPGRGHGRDGDRGGGRLAGAVAAASRGDQPDGESQRDDGNVGTAHDPSRAGWRSPQ